MTARISPESEGEGQIYSGALGQFYVEINKLREIEKTKIECARRFFSEMNKRFAPENVTYDVVDSFGKLMEIVKPA